MKKYQKPISISANLNPVNGKSSFATSAHAFGEGFTKGLFGVQFINQTSKKCEKAICIV